MQNHPSLLRALQFGREEVTEDDEKINNLLPSILHQSWSACSRKFIGWRASFTEFMHFRGTARAGLQVGCPCQVHSLFLQVSWPPCLPGLL